MTDAAGFCRELAEQAPDGPLLLALSGGLDSSLLLHLLIRAGLGPRLTVVHVDHQLQADSRHWSAFCRSLAETYQLPFVCESVNVDLREGLEAGARDARYGVLLPLASRQNATLVTAHHRSDQAETLLLRLLRGAGVQGLAAIRRFTERQGVPIWRPLLSLDRQTLCDWAGQEGIQWLDDPSNKDETLRRNFLRHQVMPLLRSKWPGADATLARAADHMSEAAGLLDEIAAADALAQGVNGAVMPLTGLAGLSAPRQRNVLRWWLQQQGATAPSQAVLAELLALQGAAEDSQARVEWGDWGVRLYRHAAYLARREQFAPWQGGGIWLSGDAPRALPGWRWCRDPQGEARQGAIKVLRPPGALELRVVAGSSKILRNGMHQRVSELWRAAGVPPWQRRQWPLLYRDGVLVSVPLVGLADGEQIDACECWYLLPDTSFSC